MPDGGVAAAQFVRHARQPQKRYIGNNNRLGH